MWNCSPGSTCEKLSTYSTHVRVFFPGLHYLQFEQWLPPQQLNTPWVFGVFRKFLSYYRPTEACRNEMKGTLFIVQLSGCFYSALFCSLFSYTVFFFFFFLHHISTAIKKSVSNLHLSLNWQHFSHPNNYNYCLLFRKALDILYIWKDFIFLKRLWWNNLLKDISSCRKTSEIIFMIDSRLD